MLDRLHRALPALALVMSLALAGCAGSGAPAAPTAVATAIASPAPSTATGPFIIEDGGIETPLVAGTYTSRLFTPALEFELGEGWFRRDPNTDRVLNLRRAPDGAEDITFISGLDYLQCGSGEVVKKPNAAAIVAAIAGSDKLDATEPVDVTVGGRPAHAIRLNGGGDPVPEESFGITYEFGCVISVGDDPFPAESFWLALTPEVVAQLIFLDVDGTTVAIRGRSDKDPDTFFDLVLDVAEHAKLG